jgi:large subunit ribosomal protein L18e
MVKKTGPRNLELLKLIKELKGLSRKENVKIWKRVANDLLRPKRIRRKVNIYNIDRYTRDNETAIVPGKVLSMGQLTKKIEVAAYQFSEAAKDKLGKRAITILELMKKNPRGKKVRIIG